MTNQPVICEIRYVLDPARIAEFEDYARTWIALIERHGGTHLGFYVACAAPAGNPMSFPGRGEEAAGDNGIALFSFPSDAAYRAYREQVARDPDGIAANDRYRDDPPFHSYQRLFLRAVSREAVATR